MSKKTVRAEEEHEYYSQASDWDADQVKRSKRSEKIAWRVAGVGLLIGALCAGSNLMLYPLKEVQNQIIRVDTVTGVVDVQRVMKDSKTTYSEETDKYWLKLYVRQREGYLFDEFQYIYKSVGMLSASNEQKKWFDYYKPENPNSPIQQYSNRVKARVKIISTTFIDKQLANIRFKKTIEQAGATPIETYWVATLKYRYVDAPRNENDREINPLGFQVTEYRVDPETNVSTPGVKE